MSVNGEFAVTVMATGIPPTIMPIASPTASWRRRNMVAGKVTYRFSDDRDPYALPTCPICPVTLGGVRAELDSPRGALARWGAGIVCAQLATRR